MKFTSAFNQALNSLLSSSSSSSPMPSRQARTTTASQPSMRLTMLGLASLRVTISSSAARRTSSRSSASPGAAEMLRAMFVRCAAVVVDIDEDDDSVSWPETIEDKLMPKIDGAMTLYDITDRTSLVNVPEMLSECEYTL